jgi:BirA family biotin operon repressor/biotin-[acetyl-CoA-carboxylase] ligase
MITHDYPRFLKVIKLDQCDSTNNYLKKHYEELRDELPVLVTCGCQTAGRGRGGRTWISPAGKGLYSSFGFLLADRKNLKFLPLLAGISVIETLKEVTGQVFGLKWPNDVFYLEKKVAGILIENIITESVFCVTGIGINLNHKVEDFPRELLEKAVSLRMITGLTYNPGQIDPFLAGVFFHWLEKLKRGDRGEIVGAANRYSEFLMYRNISFHEAAGGIIMEGIFKGINRDGGLILGREGGRSTVHYSGEIE